MCGHGSLIVGAVTEAYNTNSYYEERRANGVGYDNYVAERGYREARAHQLLEWIFASAPCRPRTLLEVGSGFGFTRRAAEALGCSTLGVDVNPAAAIGAQALYAYRTITSTLPAAVAAGDVNGGNWDMLLYQFVLEHIADVRSELRAAADCLSAEGVLALLIPSFGAAELDVFGASYRSLRADHLHLFSWRSLDLLLDSVGLRRIAWKTDCSVHLLRAFLTTDEVREIYRAGRGPDMVVLAGKVWP
jgi:hypothetical protein